MSDIVGVDGKSIKAQGRCTQMRELSWWCVIHNWLLHYMWTMCKATWTKNQQMNPRFTTLLKQFKCLYLCLEACLSRFPLIKPHKDLCDENKTCWLNLCTYRNKLSCVLYLKWNQIEMCIYIYIQTRSKLVCLKCMYVALCVDIHLGVTGYHGYIGMYIIFRYMTQV